LILVISWILYRLKTCGSEKKSISVRPSVTIVSPAETTDDKLFVPD